MQDDIDLDEDDLLDEAGDMHETRKENDESYSTGFNGSEAANKPAMVAAIGDMVTAGDDHLRMFSVLDNGSGVSHGKDTCMRKEDTCRGLVDSVDDVLVPTSKRGEPAASVVAEMGGLTDWRCYDVTV